MTYSSKNKRVRIGKDEAPAYLNTATLIKAMGGEEKLREMWEKYKANRATKILTAPSELQYKMARLKRDGMHARDVATKLNVSVPQVHGAVSRVAMWEFMVVNKPKTKKPEGRLN